MNRRNGKNCCGLNPYHPPECLVAGCHAPVIAEVHFSDYLKAWQLFGHATSHSKKPDHPHFICEKHLHEDPRSKSVKWQCLLFSV
jgi:hypothetical protein